MGLFYKRRRHQQQVWRMQEDVRLAQESCEQQAYLGRELQHLNQEGQNLYQFCEDSRTQSEEAARQSDCFSDLFQGQY